VTDITGDGYPKYRRRDNKNDDHRTRLGGQTHNGFVVPYNPYLSKTFNAHINVEMCHAITATKYLCKYFTKGHDRAQVQLRQHGDELGLDEISHFLDARCVTAPEAAWRLLQNPLHDQSHTIVELAVHLPDFQKRFCSNQPKQMRR